MKPGDMLLLLGTFNTVWVSKSGVSNLISFNGPQTDHEPGRSVFHFLYHYQIHPIKMYRLYITHRRVFTYIDAMSFQSCINHQSDNEN